MMDAEHVEELINKANQDSNTSKYKYEVDELLSGLSEVMLKELADRDAMIAGGSLLSVFTGNVINDLDIYFKTEEAMALTIDMALEDKYICASWTNKSCVFVKANHTTLNFIMFKSFRNLQNVFSSFDFTCVMAGVNVASRTVEMHNDFMRDNLKKRLVYSSSNYYPMGTIYRVSKYEEKGYSISRKELAKIMVKILDVKIENVSDLEDQLGTLYGIDLKEVFRGIETLDTCMILERLDSISGKELYGEPKPESGCGTSEKFAKRFNNIIVTRVCGNNATSYIGNEVLTQEFEENSTREVDLKIKYPLYAYKVVNNDLRSFFNNGFKYVIGEVAVADKGHGLYCETSLKALKSSIYYNRIKNGEGRIIELKIEERDVIHLEHNRLPNKTRVAKALITREISGESEMIQVDYDKDISEFLL